MKTCTKNEIKYCLLKTKENPPMYHYLLFILFLLFRFVLFIREVFTLKKNNIDSLTTGVNCKNHTTLIKL